MTTPDANLQRRVDRLEAAVAKLQRELGNYQDALPIHPRDIFHAISVLPEQGSYPSSGRWVPISISDAGFADGVLDDGILHEGFGFGSSYLNTRSELLAYNLHDSMPPHGTLLVVFSDRRGGFSTFWRS